MGWRSDGGGDGATYEGYGYGNQKVYYQEKSRPTKFIKLTRSLGNTKILINSDLILCIIDYGDVRKIYYVTSTDDDVLESLDYIQRKLEGL